MKKKIEKENEKVYTAGDVVVLLENINDGIQLLAENQMEMKKDIKNIKDDIDVMKTDIVDIKFELKRKVSYDEFEKLEKRVIRLEKVSFAK